MKPFTIIFCLMLLVVYKGSAQKVIDSKDAHKYIGKEVTVKDRYWIGFNSSYVQIACFKLGPDSTHIQLTVYVQGALYGKGSYGKINPDKTIELTGIIYKGKDGSCYMNTTR